MATTLILKHSSNPNAKPVLVDGEMAINTATKTLHITNNKTITPTVLKTINGESLMGVGDITVTRRSDLDNYADAGHTHDIDFYTPGTEKVFLTNSELSSAISVNDRVNQVNLDIESFKSGDIKFGSDFKVRTSETGTNKFLSEYLTNSFSVTDGKVSVTGIHGMVATSEEINFLGGIAGEVQAVLDGYKNTPTFAGVSQSKFELDNRTVNENEMFIVIADETHRYATSIYVVKNNSLELISAFYGYNRDFTIDPIDLNTEVTGKLSRELFPAQSAVDTPIRSNPPVFGVFTNVEQALTQLMSELQ